jgi:hypothetical protein
LLHQLERIGFHERPVLDRVDTGINRFLRRRVAVAMDRDFPAEPMRFIDECGHFRRIQLRYVDLVG